MLYVCVFVVHMFVCLFQLHFCAFLNVYLLNVYYVCVIVDFMMFFMYLVCVYVCLSVVHMFVCAHAGPPAE